MGQPRILILGIRSLRLSNVAEIDTRVAENLELLMRKAPWSSPSPPQPLTFFPQLQLSSSFARTSLGYSVSGNRFRCSASVAEIFIRVAENLELFMRKAPWSSPSPPQPLTFFPQLQLSYSFSRIVLGHAIFRIRCLCLANGAENNIRVVENLELSMRKAPWYSPCCINCAEVFN